MASEAPAPRPTFLLNAVQFGAVTGASGALYGATVGILRSTPPVIFAIGSGLQWFGLGSIFWASRELILGTSGVENWFRHTRGAPPIPINPEDISPNDRIIASTAAGGISGGSVAGIFRGPRNILPGAIMFSLIGFAGQNMYNLMDARHSQQVATPGNKENVFQRLANARWTPVKNLSDQEYTEMLQEKLLRVEAEIALLDEKITELKQEEKESQNRIDR